MANFIKSLAFRPILLSLFLGLSLNSFSQSAYFNLNQASNSILDRLEIKSGNIKNQLFLDAKPLRRDAVAGFISQFDSSSSLNIKLTPADNYWINYLKNDNLPWSGIDPLNAKRPVLKYFYRSKANFYQYTDSSFHVFINPVLAFEGGKESISDKMVYRNTRGVEIRGSIDKKVGFYSYITENQLRLPEHIRQYTNATGAVPGEGFTKPYKDSAGRDFFNTRGYITFSPTRHIHMQFGNDRNFIGNGYRSLLLSDFAKDYLSLKINTQIWRFNYQNIFAQFTDFQPRLPKPYPKKYGAFHYLSLDVTKFWNIGVMEGIMFNDRKNEGRGFDFSYLNPVIFYRSVEHNLGSPDNALAGMNTSFIFMKHFRLYGQVVLDEFVISELRKNRGWWGNKYALQAGFKYIDMFGLPNIDWQTEFNLVRPYTYSSDTPANSFSQFNQALAHPRGANFRELINILRINTYGPVDIKLKYILTEQGKDTSNSNYGSNILLSYKTRQADYGNSLLQGNKSITQYMEAVVSWQARQNLFLDINAIYRTEKADFNNINTNNFYLGAGLRLNFISQTYDF